MAYSINGDWNHPSLWIAARERPLRRLVNSVGTPLDELALESCLLPTTATRDRLRQVNDRARSRIIRRHNNQCAICRGKQSSLDVHHIFHHACGGKTEEDNLIPLCEVCHNFAHLGVWPTTFLQELVANPGTNRAAVADSARNEDQIRAMLHDTVHGRCEWQQRVRRLLDLWDWSARLRPPALVRQLELTARIQWELSNVLTTYGPSGENVPFRNMETPLNRLIGLGLAERGLKIASFLEREHKHLGRDLRTGIIHSLCVHHRSSGRHGMALTKFRRWCRELEQPEQAKRLIKDSAWRAYLLSAYGLDLVRQGRFCDNTHTAKRGMEILDKCVSWVRNGGDRHAYVDAVLRQAESRIYAGRTDEGLRLLDQEDALIKADARDVPIICSVHHKLLMVGLARNGEIRAAERAFAIAMAAARGNSLSDQERKLQRLHADYVLKPTRKLQ